jgi:hypothetical protein
VTQYFALRRVLSNPLRWIPIAFLGWHGGFQLGFALSPAPGEYPLLAAGLIYGGITGLALKFLLVPVDPPLPTQ